MICQEFFNRIDPKLPLEFQPTTSAMDSLPDIGQEISLNDGSLPAMGMPVTMLQTAMLVTVDMGQIGRHQQVEIS